MSDLWRSYIDGGAKAITREDIERAMKAIQEAPVTICGVTHPHLVHPKAEGWTGCANLCGGYFYVEQVDGVPKIVGPPS